MFCHNCGAQMPDGVKFCTNCGQKLYEEPQNEVKAQPQPQAQPQQPYTQPQAQVQPQPYYPQGYYPVPPKKKSKAPLVVLLVCLMVFILGGIGFFAYRWVNSPDKKALRALSTEDYDTVNYLYDDVTGKTADAIKDEYRSKFTDMEQQYENGHLDYTEVYGFAVVASEKVLKDDSVFTQLYDRLEMIHDSRDAYAAAEEYFSKGMYSEALIAYMEVSVNDTQNYSDALDKIKACNDMMQDEIVGTWVYTIDAKPLMEGFEFWDSPINIDVYFEFDEDGTGQIFISNEAMMDAFREPATALMEKELEKQGLSKSYLDIMLKLGGYDDIMDAIKDFAPEESVAFFNGEDLQEFFAYNVDGDEIIINGYSKLDFVLDGDYLMILTDDNNLFGFADLNLKPPYTLIRTYG